MDTATRSKIRGAAGAALLVVALALLAVAATQVGKAVSAKGAAERQEATVVSVLTFKDEGTDGPKSLIPTRVTRATFDVDGMEGERVTGYADARLVFPAKAPKPGDRVSVYRVGATKEFFMDRWPWNYGAAVEAGVPGVLLGAVGAALLVPVLRRRKNPTAPNA